MKKNILYLFAVLLFAAGIADANAQATTLISAPAKYTASTTKVYKTEITDNSVTYYGTFTIAAADTSTSYADVVYSAPIYIGGFNSFKSTFVGWGEDTQIAQGRFVPGYSTGLETSISSKYLFTAADSLGFAVKETPVIAAVGATDASKLYNAANWAIVSFRAKTGSGAIIHWRWVFRKPNELGTGAKVGT